MNSGDILRELVRRFDWFQNLVLPEFAVDGGQADLVIVSKALYLTEIEIKVSMADWNADQAKAKWKLPRPHVSRFFYAGPADLIARAPAWVPETVGLIAVHESDRRTGSPIYSREVRAAKRRKAQKLSDDLMRQIREAFYYRYWRLRLRVEREKRDRILNRAAAA